MNRRYLGTIAAALLTSLSISAANAAQEYWVPLIQQSESTHTAAAPTGRENWYGFSPDGLGMPLVLYGIYSARQSIHMLAYILTNRQIIEALARKAQAGVTVTVVVDYGESIQNDRDGYIRRGLEYLAHSGAQVCSTDAFLRMHDKSMVIDGRSVQEGSVNYTGAGDHSNSEDAFLAWNDPTAAAGFEQHFQARLATCRPL